MIVVNLKRNIEIIKNRRFRLEYGQVTGCCTIGALILQIDPNLRQDSSNHNQALGDFFKLSFEEVLDIEKRNDESENPVEVLMDLCDKRGWELQWIT